MVLYVDVRRIGDNCTNKGTFVYDSHALGCISTYRTENQYSALTFLYRIDLIKGLFE